MRTQGLRLEQAPPLDIPLRFFLTAPFFGGAAGLMLLVRGGALLQTPFHPETLALTHLITLGWLTMTMVGALYQIVPVLIGVPLPAVVLARSIHAALTGGVLALTSGLALENRALLLAAVIALGAGFGVFLIQLALALFRSQSLSVTAASLRLAALALLGTVILGGFLALEHAFGWLPISRGAWVSVHAWLGIAGWIGLLITAVGYAVVPMFYLSHPFPRRRAWAIVGALTLAVLTAPVSAMVFRGAGAQILPFGAAGFAMILFAATVLGQLHHRRRKTRDATLLFWRMGLVAGVLSLAPLAAFWIQPDPRWLFTFGIMFLIGGAGAIEMGMTYKIVPFLVWLHRFSADAGKAGTPLLRDIVSNRAATIQWGLAVFALCLCIAVVWIPGISARLAGAALFASNATWWVIVLRAARFDATAFERQRAAVSAPRNG